MDFCLSLRVGCSGTPAAAAGSALCTPRGRNQPRAHGSEAPPGGRSVPRRQSRERRGAQAGLFPAQRPLFSHFNHVCARVHIISVKTDIHQRHLREHVPRGGCMHHVGAVRVVRLRPSSPSSQPARSPGTGVLPPLLLLHAWPPGPFRAPLRRGRASSGSFLISSRVGAGGLCGGRGEGEGYWRPRAHSRTEQPLSFQGPFAHLRSLKTTTKTKKQTKKTAKT